MCHLKELFFIHFIILTNVSLSQVTSGSEVDTDSDSTQVKERSERDSIADSIASSDNGQVGDQGRGRGRGRGRRRGRGRGREYAVTTLAQPAPVDPGWEKTEDVAPPTVKPFTDTSGPTETLLATSTPLAFFRLMFSADFFETLAEATNLNAVEKHPPPAGAAHGRLDTSDPKWHMTSADEMHYFFAINMVMGINVKPEYKDYWRGDIVLRDSYISAIMTRLRYEKLTQYFHCSVNGQEDPADKVRKVRPMITQGSGHVFCREETFPSTRLWSSLTGDLAGSNTCH